MEETKEKRHRAKLTKQDHQNIIRLKNNGVPSAVIANKYGCSYNAVWNICHNEKLEEDEVNIDENAEPVLTENEVENVLEESMKFEKMIQQEDIIKAENKNFIINSLGYNNKDTFKPNRKMRRQMEKEKRSKNKHQIKKEMEKMKSAFSDAVAVITSDNPEKTAEDVKTFEPVVEEVVENKVWTLEEAVDEVEKELLDDCNVVDEEEEEIHEEEVEQVSFTKDELEEEVEDPDDNCIVIGENAYPVGDFKLTRLHKPTIHITKYFFAGLIDNRHDIPVKDFIYDNGFEEKYLFDYNKQYEDAKKFIKDRVPENGTLVLYVTGLQCALSSVVRACTNLGINLITMNHNSASDTYSPQINIEIFDGPTDIVNPFPFNILLRKSSSTYLYNCTTDDIISSNDAVCFTINIHNANYDKKYIDTKYIVAANLSSEVWDLYGKLIEVINNQVGIKLSVLLAKITVTSTRFNWENNISKGYNFK